MSIQGRDTKSTLRYLVAIVASAALALVLVLTVSSRAYAAAPAQPQGPGSGMGGMTAPIGHPGAVTATEPISAATNMAAPKGHPGAMMVQMTGMMGMMGMMQTMMAGGMMGEGMMGEGMMGGEMMGAGGMGMMGVPAATAVVTATVAETVTATVPAVTPEPAAAAAALIPAGQKVTAGAITVEVTPLASDDALEVAFAVTLDTHSVDLSFDLAERATLTIGAAKFSATAWEPETPGGHHVPGVLRFVIDQFAAAQLSELSEVTLELHDIDGQHVTLNFPLTAE